MARRVADYQPPAGPLNVTLITWDRGREMRRVHDSAYLGNQFNPTSSGNARFSPIRDSSGVIIPTLYAGTTLGCALMETIFHDLPYKAGFKPVSKRKLIAKVHSIVLPKIGLLLVDLGTVALHKLGIDRAHLIETTKALYPRTRSWAEALYAEVLNAHGLSWTSRRHDHEQAVVLFGGRLNPSDLEISGPSIPLLEGTNAAVPVIDLATRLDATLVD
jgi:RES domain